MARGISLKFSGRPARFVKIFTNFPQKSFLIALKTAYYEKFFAKIAFFWQNY
jgi:hypothetical protein